MAVRARKTQRDPETARENRYTDTENQREPERAREKESKREPKRERARESQRAYLIFVIFFTQPQFEAWKFYT